MNPLLAIGLLALLRKSETFGLPRAHSAATRAHARRAHRSLRHGSGKPVQAAVLPATHAHTTPADHAAAEHAAPPVPEHASPADKAAAEAPEAPTEHKEPPPPEHKPVAAAHHKKRGRKHHTSASPATPVVGVVAVSDVQRILVGLGWRGHLTTKGALSSELTDGLYGPTTHADWQQSANKRGLDPTFERIDGRHVHVNAATLDALTQAARAKGSIAGLYIP